jgi:hypothetical protein
MMETASTSETLVNVYQTTRRYNPEDSHLRIHRRENFKSYLTIFKFLYLTRESPLLLRWQNSPGVSILPSLLPYFPTSHASFQYFPSLYFVPFLPLILGI